MRNTSFIRGAAFAVSLLMASSALAASCDTSVMSALDQQRQQYIAASSDLADQNYSRRPGTFAATTCLDSLMKQSGVDIFFKPPSLDSILNLVKNFACEQASQIFDKLLGGSGSSTLKAGELLSGINLGGLGGGSGASSMSIQSSSKSNVDVSLRKLFQ
ncbi:hypothetical protein G6L37_03985 [Agrobacterium rubi]|nr:hypothetical protein [Agrobacterium rubi]NTF24510.1 hypothetical protein [Agrobacterium rubi]